MVNPELCTHEQMKQFDFLILVGNTNVDIESIVSKIKTFTDNGGCLFIEVEGNISSSIQGILPAPIGSLTRNVSTESGLSYDRNEESSNSDLNLQSKNQTWDISQSIFDAGYGVYGRINQTINAFSKDLTAQYSSVTTNVGPVVLQFKTNVNESGSVSCGTIILNTVSLNVKAGADYLFGSELSESAAANSGSMVITSDAEGPLKFFYNSIIVGLISKYYTSSNSSGSSSPTLLTPVLFHSTSWKTSWLLNGIITNDKNPYNDILIKNDYIDEYAEYKFTVEQNGDLYRQLSDKTIEEIFIEEFSRSVPSSYGQFYSTSNDKITYFIEFTNSSVSAKNGTYLPNSIAQGVTTPYKTYQIPASSVNQPAFAKTTTISPPLNIPSNYGLFYIKDRFRNIENRREYESNIVNDNVHNYTYGFKTEWKKVVSTESSLSFDMSYNIDFTIQVPITIKSWRLERTIIGRKSIPEGEPLNASFITPFPSLIRKNIARTGYPLGAINTNISSTYLCKQDITGYENIHNPINKSIFNHFPYTGDIDLGNTSHQYSHNGSGNDENSGPYVHYIQWTLRLSGQNIVTDGQFGPQTKAAVISFQKTYKAAVIDGTVDSETKSIMAYFWGKAYNGGILGQFKNQISRYYNNTVNRPNVGKKVLQYIDAAIQADPVTTATTGNIKRISYSGAPLKTPSSIVGVFVIALPSALTKRTIKTKINKITVSSGDTNISVESAVMYKEEFFGPGNFYTVNNEELLRKVPANGGLNVLGGNVTFVGANNSSAININVEYEIGSPYKYLVLAVRGSKLPNAKYGSAQGIFINNIAFEYEPDPGQTEGEPEYGDVPKEAGSINVNGYIDVTATKSVHGLTIANTPKDETITSANYYSLPLTVRDFYYINQENQKQTFTYKEDSPTRIISGMALDTNSVSQINFLIGTTNEWGEVTVNLSRGIVAPEESVTVHTKKVAPTGQTPSASSAYIDYIQLLLPESQSNINGTSQFVVKYDVDISKISREVFYGGETTIGEHRHLYASFLTAGEPKTNKVSPTNKNTVDYLAGIVCLCDSQGRPVGFPSTFTTSSTDTRSENITNIYVKKTNSMPTSDELGLVYGFYDISTKKLLGKNISYSEYLERNGKDNIYIAVVAIDYDGNTLVDDLDFSGFSTIPVSISRVPNRIVCPVYNVKFQNRASIQLFKPQSYLDKKSEWHVGISAGSFTKDFHLNVNQIYNQDLLWIKKYFDSGTSTKPEVAVRCFYDTFFYSNSGWSKILGKPYADIYEEKPLILDSKTIKLRQTPVAAIHEPSEDITLFGSPIKPYVFIYTRESVSSPWVKVDFSDIAIFDCHTGLIQFKRSLVPNDINLIKVNYAVEISYRPIKIINNKVVNLNPYLDKKNIKFNKPIFFYIIPRSIEIVGKRSLQSSYKEIIETQSTLAYTEDGRIFDPGHPLYNPFAILISTIYVVDRNVLDSFKLNDLRLKGGGLFYQYDSVEIIKNIPSARSFWDISGPDGYAYVNSGYLIIQLPSSLKNHMSNAKIRETIDSAITAGVVYEIQDYDGNPWGDL